MNLKCATWLLAATLGASLFLAACGGGGGGGGGSPQSQPATQPGQSQSGTQPGEALTRFIAIDLHPTAYAFSIGWGIGDGEQAGQSEISNTRPGPVHALLWRGTALSVVDLHPSGFTQSAARATSGGVQTGWGNAPQGRHALKWLGSAASVVDLHPSGFVSSEAFSVSGDHIVGAGFVQLDTPHALLWTSGGVVDLHPSGFTTSSANGTDGTQQVGSGSNPNGGMGATNHALLWRGTGASVVDLHPATGYFSTNAFAVSGGQQVGEGFIGSNAHALLWMGSAQSVVDLNPSGFFDSHALGVAAGRQVGYGVMSGTGATHALLWNGGTADSVVDLHAFLPAGFAHSEAHGIDASGNIIGAADGHAILWVPQR